MGYRVDLHEGSCYHLHLGARGVLRFRRTPQGDFEMLESPLAADLLGDEPLRHDEQLFKRATHALRFPSPRSASHRSTVGSRPTARSLHLAAQPTRLPRA